MCDNCKHPKVKIDVTKELQEALQAVVALNENYVAKILVDFLRGKDTKEMDDYGFSELSRSASEMKKTNIFGIPFIATR